MFDVEPEVEDDRASCVPLDLSTAPVPANGNTTAMTAKAMMAVAAQSRARRAGGSALAVGCGLSGSQRSPFQNMERELLSATRLTQGVPWLCGPASRRVCYFVEASASLAVGLVAQL
jgi:hypothetical protein